MLYEYGKIGTGLKARKNKLTKKVEFLIWNKGEQGHKEDCYIRCDPSWDETFISEQALKEKNHGN